MSRAHWNHNSAYHPWLVRRAARVGGDVLDVGCGEGLLLERLAPVSATVHGIDPDAPSVARARARVRGLPNASVQHGGLADVAGTRRYDVVTFVASLHHMELVPALERSRDLLRPGGVLLVVGLAANRSLVDRAVSLASLPVARIGSWLHRERWEAGVPMADARESLREIRDAANAVVPGARVRRALYYRYLLRWRKPERAGSRA